MTDDRRLIEDYLPIEAISSEASREKSVRKGHISTLHLWWARRPLVACRAAVYGALVPLSRFVPNGASDEKKKSLGRANAAKFVQRLCRYPSDNKPSEKADIERAVREARRHILDAHAERLSAETGGEIKTEDILEGRSPRPKVLDMFAGGGAIPFEALRLGCDAYALDLNPVAHLIELCTLIYPQKYGKADTAAIGRTGPKNAEGTSSWGGLSSEVRYWGEWVLEKAKAEIGEFYPLVRDREFRGKKTRLQEDWLKPGATDEVPPGHLMPVAYLWTRTVTCKNPNCRVTVPLVRQTWLRKKQGNYAAINITPSKGTKKVEFDVVTSRSEKGLGFDPAGWSKGGNATCPFCGTVADIDHVKTEGWAGRLGVRMMAVACRDSENPRAKVYVSADREEVFRPDEKLVRNRIDEICKRHGLTIPDEQIANLSPDDNENTLGIRVRPYGIRTFSALLLPRQLLALLSFAGWIRRAEKEMSNYSVEHRVALLAMLACFHDRLADFSSTACVWNSLEGERTAHTFGRHAISMTWDFAETDPFNPANAGWPVALERIIPAIKNVDFDNFGTVQRGSAMSLPWPDQSMDAVITDPPYYDNVPYSDISDFFYVWLKRTVGHLFPTEFAAPLTPKKSEAIADADRHGGSWDEAKKAYEDMMLRSFREAYRVLKAEGQFAAVYAHKTTLGWATLVDALRRAGFTISEAWPLDTEKPGRLRAQQSAALASSIFLVGRKRQGVLTGNYEAEVRPELDSIVRERVGTLWDAGVSGADLVIACVGAGLRAFTRFARVEYANGEQVPAERFLAEVETLVLENILGRLSREVGPRPCGQT